MRNSLRFRLTILFIGLATLPLVVVSVVLAQRNFSVLSDQAIELQSEVAQRIGKDVTALVGSRESELFLLTRVRSIVELSREEQLSILSRLLAETNTYEELAIMDSEGQEITHIGSLQIFAEEDLQNRAGLPEFEETKASGQAYYSPVQFNEETGEPFMIISVPSYDLRSGEFNGVLTGNFRFKPIWDLMGSAQVPGNGTVYVVDAANRVVAHRDPAVVLQNTQFELADEDGFYPGLGSENAAIASTLNRFGSQEFHTVAELEANEAVSLAITTFFLTITATVIALIMAIVISVFAARRIVQPIAGLATTAELIASGDLSQQVAVESSDEIGVLAAAFNSMTAQLRDFINTLEERVANRTQALATTAEVSRRISTILDQHELAIDVVEVVKETFNYYHVHMYLFDHFNQNLVLIGGTGEAGAIMLERQHAIPLGRGLVGRAAETNEAILVPDVTQEEGWLPNELLPETKAEIAVPISAGDQVFGVLDVQHNITGGLVQEDADLLQSLANQIAIAVQNANQYEQTQTAMMDAQRRSEALGAINYLANSVASILDLKEFLETVLENLQLTIPFDRFTAALYQPKEDNLHYLMIHDAQEGTRFAVPSGKLEPHHVSYKTVHETTPQLILYTPEEVATRVEEGVENVLGDKAAPTASLILVPVVSADIIGVMSIQSYRANAYDKGDVELLTGIATYVASGVQNAQLYAQTQRRAEELQIERNRTQAILESVTIPMFIFRERDSVILYANQSLADTINMSINELVGNPIPDLYSEPDEAKKIAELVTEHGALTNYEIQLNRAKGKAFWALLSMRLLSYQDEPAAMATLVDITDRKKAQQAIMKQATELQTVAEVGTTAAATLDANRLLQTVVDLTKSRFDLYHVHIFLLDEENEMLVMAAGAGEHGAKMMGEGPQSLDLHREQSLIARAARNREVVVVNNVRGDPGYMPHPLLPDTRSEMAVPLIAGDTLLGVFDVQSTMIDRFTTQDISIQSTLASQIAVALQNAQQYQQTEDQAHRLAELNTLTSEIVATIELEKIYRLFAEHIATLFNSDRTSISLLDATKTSIVVRSLHGPEGAIPAGVSIPLEKTSGTALAVREQRIVHLPVDAPMVPSLAAEGLQSAVIVPLISSGELIGTFSLSSRQPSIDRVVDINLVQQVASILATTIESRRLGEQANLLASIVEHHPDCIGIGTFEGEALYVNPAGLELMGLPSDYDVTKINASQFYPPEDAERLLSEGIPAAMESGSWATEANLLKADGTSIPVDETVGINYDAAKNPVSFSITMRDITNRKLAAEALAKRAAELETVAQVSTAIAATLDTQKLLQDVVDLTKSRFNLYHAHIYLLHETSNLLILTAGAGEVGAEMVANGLTIPLSKQQSLVAQAARNRRGVIVNDVLADPSFLSNPLLPDTQSEMAVPMIVGDRVLGVLDIQADEIDYFTPEDIHIQTTLATQIGIALNNARSFEQASQAVEELDTLTRRLRREGWESYLEARESAIRFGYDLHEFVSAETNGKQETAVALPPVALEKPLTVQGETVGHLALAEPQALTDDATEIINAVAESLSAHLENLRLTEQTEQALSQSEALYQGSAGLNTAQSYGEILEVMRKHSILGQGAGASIAAFNVPWAKKAPEWINILGRYEQKPSNNLPDRYRLKDLPSANKILKRDAPTIIQNVAKDKRLASLDSFASVASAIFVPLVAGRQWIGYVLGTYDQPTEFPESELRRLMSLAGQAASTIQSIRLFRQTQEQLADLTTIQSTTAGLTATITMDEAINTLLPHIADAVQADNIAFFNIEEEYMIPVSVYPPQPDGFSQQPQRLADYPLTEEVIKTRQALALAADDPRLQPQAQEAFKATGVTATATIPLVTRKKVFAILTITMRQPGRLFTEQEVGLLQTLADQASIAIERVRLLEETARKAQREQMLREIAAKVRSSADVETIMRTAVQEIGQALGRQTFVYLDKGNSTDQT